MTTTVQNFTWNDIKNMLPIVLALLAVAGGFYGMRAELSVTNQKLEDLLRRIDVNDIKYIDHEERIRVLENNQGIILREIEF